MPTPSPTTKVKWRTPQISGIFSYPLTHNTSVSCVMCHVRRPMVEGMQLGWLWWPRLTFLYGKTSWWSRQTVQWLKVPTHVTLYGSIQANWLANWAGSQAH